MSEKQSVCNLLAWFGERFPVPHFVLGFCVSLKIGSTMHYFKSSSGLNLWHQLGYCSLAVVSFFLLLRVLDEHKDFEKDLKNHPERVLQQGRVSLNHLKLLGFTSVLIIVAYTIKWGNAGQYSLPLLILSVVWTFLMTYEFFLKDYLTQRPLLYGVSHLFVVVLIGLWVSSTYVSEAPWWINLFVSVHLLAVSAALEVTRKSFNSLENEREGDSYSRIMGFNAAVRLAVALIAVFTVLDVVSIVVVSAGWYCVVPFLFAAAQIAQLFSYSRDGSPKKRKRAEILIGLQYITSSIVTYLTI